MAPAAEAPSPDADASTTTGAPLNMVKAEEGIDALPDFGDDAAEGDGAKDEADYGDGDGPVPPPRRRAPDYCDLDGDDGAKVEPKADEESKVKVEGKPRPNALHVTGVERLNRQHLEEVFLAKRLPLFRSLEYVADDEVLCIFRGREDVTSVLASFDAGFGDVADDGASGPGLWRARRGMMEFRQGSTADLPPLGFKRMHRSGRQVREFRLWAALEDDTKQMTMSQAQIDGENYLAQYMNEHGKREAMEKWAENYKSEDEAEENAEETGAADGEERPAKKRRKNDMEDLLTQMAGQDKEIFNEDPDAREIVDQVGQYYETYGSGVDTKAGSGDNWGGSGSWGRQRNRKDSWNEDWGNGGASRGGRNNSWKDNSWNDSWDTRGGDRSKGSKGRAKGGSIADEKEGGRPAAIHALQVDEEERARRAKRNARFAGAEESHASIATKTE